MFGRSGVPPSTRVRECLSRSVPGGRSRTTQPYLTGPVLKENPVRMCKEGRTLNRSTLTTLESSPTTPPEEIYS